MAAIFGYFPSWPKIKPGFFLAVGISLLMIQVLFLSNLSYLYGTQFKESERTHNLNILYVDYDGGIIGQSVIDAYHLLEGNTFPTIRHLPTENFPAPIDVRNAVCSGDYWGAIYALPDASDSLAAALVNGSSTVTPTTLAYVWNGARYAAYSQSAIYANIVTLIQTTRSTYYANNASDTLLSDVTALGVFVDPIHAQEINIKSTNQGTRVLYNSVSMIMPIIMQFFFMMALNGISAQYRLFSKLSWVMNGLIRMCVSVLYTLVSSLCMIGYIWGFKEDWAVNGAQFVLSWMTVWLYMHINFLLFDIMTTFIPMQFMPFCILTWMITNVASTIAPFELSPGFYRWGYALPAHEAYSILGQIWSNGCNNQLHRALPILFSWWVVGACVVVYALHYRCRQARILERKTQFLENAVDENQEDRPKTPAGSPDRILPRDRRSTMESIELERRVYGPQYPTMPGTFDNR
jgi:hypothetical protein